MQVTFRSGLQAGDGEAETDHSFAIERAERLASDLGSDDEQTDREKFDVGEAPDFPLQLDRFLELLLRGKRRDLDHGLLSRDLACCHRDSISSIVESPGTVPRSASFSST